MRIVFRLLGFLLVLFFGSTILVTLYYKIAPVSITPLMVIRAVETGNYSWQHDWTPLEEISEKMPLAVISSEDNRFMEHNGFDFKEIKKAREEAKRGGRERGASTISQQTAKNVFLWPSHSWIRKGLETYFTVLIELIWGKERIMEVYLNSIETGKGIYGVEAISRHSFGCKASLLTRRQAALIAATLPNPRRWDSANPSAYMLRRQNKISSLMGKVAKPEFDCYKK